jgi:putative transcriptional regulator
MNNVRHIRQTLGLSQDALAEALGMTQGSVSQYELGSDIPPRVARKLIDVAAGRGVDISFDDIYTSEAA